MPITVQHSMELLSRAYVTAVAAGCRCVLDAERSHDYGIDGQFHHVTSAMGRLVESGISFAFQLKASTSCQIVDQILKFRIATAYHNLIVLRNRNGNVPCFVLILVLPQRADEWISVFSKELIIRQACYYYFPTKSMGGANATLTLQIPIKQKLTPEWVDSVFTSRLKGGSWMP